jgi:hypothetical protein
MENFNRCPICGKRVISQYDLIAGPDQHRCNPRVLRAIDGAMSRDDVADNVPTKMDRFNYGCRIHDMSGDD